MQRAKKFWYWLAAVAGSLGLAVFLLAPILTRTIGVAYRDTILRLGHGKIADPVVFLKARIEEALWLLAVTILLFLAYKLIKDAIEARMKTTQYTWVPLVFAAAFLLNLWLFTAMQTDLFWAAMYTGKANSNLTQFQFKKLLLKENKAPRQILLVGSSQTQAQFDEDFLNAKLGKKIWTTELHFPGSAALDLFLVTRRLKDSPGDDLVCYLSEFYFYAPVYSESAPYFLNFADLPKLREMGFGPYFKQGQFAYGLLGQMLPPFYCREPLTYRFLGIAMAGVAGQAKYDENLETNLVKRAELVAPKFRFGADEKLQKAAFEAFLFEASAQKRRVILVEGQLNPLLSERVNPAIRADMKQFLRTIAEKYSNVILIPEDQLPRQDPSDYKDLTHVTPAAEQRFTEWFFGWLERNLNEKALAERRDSSMFNL
jgi:hypothetical protein